MSLAEVLERLDVINSYAFEFERRQHRLGEQLDKQWRELWLKWHRLNAAYHDLANVDKRDQLLSELGLVQQAMIDLEQKLDGYR